jgi:hypothetical protein
LSRIPPHLNLCCEVKPQDYSNERSYITTNEEMCDCFFYPAADIACKIDKTLELNKEVFLALLNLEPTTLCDDSKTYSIALPLADKSSLSERLKFNICDETNQTVFIITELIANAYQTLSKWMDSILVTEKHSNLFIGTTGIGKSAAMYVSSFAFRASHNDGIRVTFISAETWISAMDPIVEVLVALVRTFYSDVVGPPPDPNIPMPRERDQSSDSDAVHNSNLFAWCLYVMNGYIFLDPESTVKATVRLGQFVGRLIGFVTKNKLRWIFIVDQHNALYAQNKYDEPPFMIVHNMHQWFTRSDTFLILACSRNSELYDYPPKSLVNSDIDNRCNTVFTKSQIVRLLELLNYEKKFEYRLDVVADSIMQCSSGTPLEVSQYCIETAITPRNNTYGRNPEEDMVQYCSVAESEITTLTMRFVAMKKNNGMDMESYRRVLVDVIAQAPYDVTSYMDRVDRRFVRYVEEDSGSGHLQAINQTVLRVFQNMVLLAQENEFTKLFTSLTNMTLSNSVYYCVAELYMIRQLLQQNEHTFSLKYHSNKSVLNSGDSITFRNRLKLFRFKGSSRFRVPEYAFKGGSASAIYVPDDKQYPGVDFLIYIAGEGKRRSKLWAIQVTGSIKPSEHMKHDIDYFTPEELPRCVERAGTRSGSKSRVFKDLHRQWASYFKLDVNDVKIVWFVKNMPASCNEQKRLFVLWTDEKKIFPLLGILPDEEKEKYKKVKTSRPTRME